MPPVGPMYPTSYGTHSIWESVTPISTMKLSSGSLWILTFKSGQFAKAFVQIDSTEEGISISVKPVSAKALSPMEEIDMLIEISDKPKHPLNASAAILVTSFGILKAPFMDSFPSLVIDKTPSFTLIISAYLFFRQLEQTDDLSGYL